MKYLLFIIAAFVLLIITVTIGVQNDQVVSFNYLIAKDNYRLSTLLAILFTIGLGVGWISYSFFYLKLRIKYGLLERQLKHTQTNIKQSTNHHVVPVGKE